MKPIISNVRGHEGLCKPIWLNRNQVSIRLEGFVSGFFRNVKKRFGIWWKVGTEFHGKLVISDDSKIVVESTALRQEEP